MFLRLGLSWVQVILLQLEDTYCYNDVQDWVLLRHLKENTHIKETCSILPGTKPFARTQVNFSGDRMAIWIDNFDI